MKKVISYSVLAICFLLVTFFGLGPAMFADGSTKERMLVISVVVVLYFIIAACFEYIRRAAKTKKKRY